DLTDQDSPRHAESSTPVRTRKVAAQLSAPGRCGLRLQSRLRPGYDDRVARRRDVTQESDQATPVTHERKFCWSITSFSKTTRKGKRGAVDARDWRRLSLSRDGRRSADCDEPVHASIHGPGNSSLDAFSDCASCVDASLQHPGAANRTLSPASSIPRPGPRIVRIRENRFPQIRTICGPLQASELDTT